MTRNKALPLAEAARFLLFPLFSCLMELIGHKIEQLFFLCV